MLLSEELPIHPRTGLTAVGIVNGRPVWPILGGAEADDDDDDGVDVGGDDDDDADADADDDADDDDDDDKDKPKPKDKPTAKDTPKPGPPKPAPTNQTYSKVKADFERERSARRQVQRELEALKRQNETDAEKINREAEEKAEARYKPTAIRSAARAALVEAKVLGKADRAIPLIDLDALEVDADGEVVGLESQIILLKSEYPELFEADKTDDDDDKPAPRRKPNTKVDAGNKPPANQPKTSAEKLAARAMAESAARN